MERKCVVLRCIAVSSRPVWPTTEHWLWLWHFSMDALKTWCFVKVKLPISLVPSPFTSGWWLKKSLLEFAEQQARSLLGRARLRVESALWSYVRVVVMEDPPPWLATPPHVMDSWGARPLRWLSVLVFVSQLFSINVQTFKKSTYSYPSPNQGCPSSYLKSSLRIKWFSHSNIFMYLCRDFFIHRKCTFDQLFSVWKNVGQQLVPILNSHRTFCCFCYVGNKTYINTHFLKLFFMLVVWEKLNLRSWSDDFKTEVDVVEHPYLRLISPASCYLNSHSHSDHRKWVNCPSPFTPQLCSPSSLKRDSASIWANTHNGSQGMSLGSWYLICLLEA